MNARTRAAPRAVDQGSATHHAAADSSAHLLLSRLEGVRQAAGGWTAICPAHADRSPSLSIANGRDGRLLVRCFASCTAHEVMTAVGLSVADLFPKRLPEDLNIDGDWHGKEARRRFREERAAARQYAVAANTRAAANTLACEATIVWLAASDLETGRPLSQDDQSRLALAVQRIDAARLVLEDCR